MAICKLTSPVTKGTKLSIDINYFPVRKRFSPGIVLKKGKEYIEENNAKKELFNMIVNEWEWLLLHASPDEVLKVYELKAGEKTRNLYKSISIKDVLKQVRGQVNENDSQSIFQDSDVPASIKGAAINKSKPALSEIDFFAFYDQQHLHRKPHETYQNIKKKIRDFHGSEGALPIKDITGLGIWLYKRSQNSGGDENSRTGKTGDDFDSQSGSQPPALPSPDYTKSAPTYSPTATTSNFPIKKGSRGEYVKNLQNALIQKYGASVLPKYGADGVWGSELTKALTDKNLKTVIDNTTYTDYVTGNFGGQSSTIDPSKTTASSGTVTKIINSIIPSWVTDPNIRIGWQLFDAAKAKNIQATLSLLGQLKSVNDYTSASQGFQLRPYQLVPLHRFTLVSGLFDAFQDSSDSKGKIRVELRRIGLIEHVKNSDAQNYDSSWTLSGLGSALKDVKAKMKAIITDGFNIRVEIPANTILGRWLSSGNGYTRFRTFDGRTMYVRSSAVVLA